MDELQLGKHRIIQAHVLPLGQMAREQSTRTTAAVRRMVRDLEHRLGSPGLVLLQLATLLEPARGLPPILEAVPTAGLLDPRRQHGEHRHRHRGPVVTILGAILLEQLQGHMTRQLQARPLVLLHLVR